MTTMRSGIHRVELESGYVVGSVNAWLFEGDPFTLVDAGSLLPGAMQRLEAACAGIGRRLEEIEQIVLTHHHVDHVGLAASVAERSGAPVVALAQAATFLTDYDAQMARDFAFARVALELHGFGAEVAARAERELEAEARWAAAVRIDRSVAPGDVVEIGAGAFDVLHRPGHSETDTVFADARRGIVISGDHLMRDHASMPMFDRPIGVLADFAEEAARCARLLDYRRSLARSRGDLDGLVIPGHGDCFDAPRDVIDRHLAFQDLQAREALELFGRGETLTACALAERLWPRTALEWAFLSASTVLGLLGRLEAEEKLARVTLDDGRVGYRSR
ncbi:MBL fold metallo-hydrolase [Conexibacter stalactiti]|uniref:MBL fold metallo-hydrolase n=1 Tax=Conexibacter stalactiti TaxID=1940611 RepID=A0ABU4HKD3_9ACTN|nr:MBL fold metallo-hydrolase [Conexibacter stalactiti]MDW5593152.1 MBL fold metallo-hydrolase [Conexibacter stalactiti]MEC5033793.1 MBL fold metallo-hydrolase [Conexibacter stalactiti]